MASDTGIRDRRRADILGPICDHLLAHGLEAANLRALARAAGTSDRMLLYYFADKDDLISSALERLADALAETLAANGPKGALSADRLTEEVWSAVRRSDLWPYMVLFIEVATSAARGREPYVAASRLIARRFLDWLAARLDITDAGERTRHAARILATIDGLVLLHRVDPTIVRR